MPTVIAESSLVQATSGNTFTGSISTIPAGSVLVVGGWANNNGTNTPANPTLGISVTGGALTWQTIVQTGAAGGAALWAAYVPTQRTAVVITVTSGGAAFQGGGMKAYVVGGDLDTADPFGGQSTGFDLTQSATTDPFTAERSSLMFCSAQVYIPGGTRTAPSSSDLDDYDAGAGVASQGFLLGWEEVAQGEAASAQLTTSKTGAYYGWNWATLEIRGPVTTIPQSGSDAATVTEGEGFVGPPPGGDAAGLTDDPGDLTATHAQADSTTSAETAVAVAAQVASDQVSVTSDATDLEMSIRVALEPAYVDTVAARPAVAHVVDLAGARVDTRPSAPAVAHVVDLKASPAVVQGAVAFGGGTAPNPGIVEVAGPELAWARAGDGPGTYGVARPPRTPRARLIAQQILDGRFISWELPVSDPEVTHTLGGATQIAGMFAPEIRALADLGLTPWGTWVHLEEAGAIRGSAILQPTSIGPDGRMPLSALGFMGYAAKVPYRGRYSGIGVDPAAVVRHLWEHIQGFPRGNLGVQVVGSTPITIGTQARDVQFVTGEGEVVDFVAGPYTLDYWNNTLCGSEMDKLSTETPFDMVERSFWTTPARQAIAHRLELSYPQRGSRRNDLRFALGENIVEWAPVEEPPDAYADTVYVLGKGEGIDAVKGEATLWVGERLRMPALVDDKTIDNTARATAVAKEELAARLSALVEIPEIVVDTRHRNAPYGSYTVGDEILPRIRVPYLGMVRAWHRITSIRYLPHTNRAALSLTRRGEFRG